ncbi:hypothetical protein MRX96_056578 [Rhipicephalus microplus]
MNHNGEDTELSVNGESPTRVSASLSISRESVSRHVPAGVVDHDEEASSSENELVIDEQENAADAAEDEEVAVDNLKAAEESEEEGPILETDNVRSPSPRTMRAHHKCQMKRVGWKSSRMETQVMVNRVKMKVMEPKKMMMVVMKQEMAMRRRRVG